jgi:3alpha(or 20beta)-hydroxysteroid dehydrogenase
MKRFDNRTAIITGGARGVGLSAIPRIAEPEEITRMVLFVASDEASFSTGSEFIADGGLLLGPVPNSSPRA